MKKKDMLVIGAIAVLAGVVALIVSTVFIAAPTNLKTEVEVVSPISTEFTDPDPRYFNANSLNPTRLIRIEESQNQNPFN